ncbi:MAG: hypothetical protein JO151_10935 [Verrucomicrobia bacterium]|nr:hypothetical protein [Verrucomicrobiota bacterium]
MPTLTVGILPRTSVLHAISSIPLLWNRLKNASQVSDVYGSPRLEGFYRKLTGPGWLLTGDAAHFKHPASAQGIGTLLKNFPRQVNMPGHFQLICLLGLEWIATAYLQPSPR